MSTFLTKYTIKRSFRDPKKEPKVIKIGLSLEEAQEHCKDPKTRKAGEWFDYYTEEE